MGGKRNQWGTSFELRIRREVTVRASRRWCKERKEKRGEGGAVIFFFVSPPLVTCEEASGVPEIRYSS